MNKQELIEKIRDLDKIYGTSRFYVDVDGVLELVELLDEPQKPVVPQFVADWYKNHKDDLEYDIWEYMINWNKQQKSEFYEWMNHANNKPLQTLANMHQFGYEVEKEPRYIVKVKSTKCSTTSLVFSTLTGAWFFSVAIYQGVRFKHTRKELEDDGFGWVFDCPGIEIDEVE